MHDFLQIVRSALRYRFIASVAFICSLAVGGFWGANIGALYPMLQVVFHGESIGELVARKAEERHVQAAELLARQQALEQELAQADGGDRTTRERELALLRSQTELAEQSARSLQQAANWLLEHGPRGPFETILLVLGFVLLGTVIKGVFLVANEVLVSRLTQLAVFDLRNRFFRHALRMDQAQISDDRVSQLMTRFTHDMMRVTNGVQALLGQATREPLKMLACLIGACFISWQLLLLSVAVGPLFVISMRWLAIAVRRTSDRNAAAMDALYARLGESFHGLAVVKAFTMEGREARRFYAVGKRIFRQIQRMCWFQAVAKPVVEVMGLIVVSIGLLAGVYLVVNQTTQILGVRFVSTPMTPAGLMVFYAMLIGATDPLRKMSGISITIHRSAAAAERIGRLLAREPKIRDPENPVALPVRRGQLRFEGVGFAYRDPGEEVLRDIDLHIEEGECVALIGANGCGKSTLVNLVPRFFDPTRGVVSLRGVDLRDLRLKDLRRRIGIVTQSTLLFDDTVFNNIRYGSPGASRREVIAAACQAGADSFISAQLEDGYDTVIGERGGHLSGGQAQRIALARAILRDPEILILDEATSNIDREAEQAIHAALANFRRNRTVLMVTHHPANLALADRVVVMQAGRIVDVGAPEEVLARSSFGRQMDTSDFRRAG